jgi:hypothetical protein
VNISQRFFKLILAREVAVGTRIKGTVVDVALVATSGSARRAKRNSNRR